MLTLEQLLVIRFTSLFNNIKPNLSAPARIELSRHVELVVKDFLEAFLRFNVNKKFFEKN